MYLCPAHNKHNNPADQYLLLQRYPAWPPAEGAAQSRRQAHKHSVLAILARIDAAAGEAVGCQHPGAAVVFEACIRWWRVQRDPQPSKSGCFYGCSWCRRPDAGDTFKSK